MKRCSKCGETKPLTEFNKDKSTRDGLRYECRDCSREYFRQYRQENKEKEQERNRQYRQENKERITERKKQYAEENKEIIAERGKQYRQKNRDKILEKLKQYYQTRKTSQPACVYEIINTINNKLYVGQTTRGEMRWEDHLKGLRGGYHGNPNLQEDFNQYGEDAFEWRTIKEFETKDEQLLITEESRIINQYIDEGKNLYNVVRPPKEVG